MPTDTKNVFIDTQVFDKHHLDFLFSPKFQRLNRLAGHDELHVVLTDVTISEIRRHIDAAAKEAVKQILDYRKIIRAAKRFISPKHIEALEGVQELDLAKELRSEFDRFLCLTDAEIITVDTVSPGSIFKKYFTAKAPFGPRNKKEEFPDAFASAALEAWCKKLPGRKLYVVSEDKDWRCVCKETPEFIYIQHLEELLDKFTDSEVAVELKTAIHGKSDDILDALKEAVSSGQIYFYTDDDVVDGEVIDSSVHDVQIEQVSVIEAAAGEAILVLVFRASASLIISGDHLGSLDRDDDDGSDPSVWTTSGEVKRGFEAEATINLRYDIDNPRKISISDISIRSEAFGI